MAYGGAGTLFVLAGGVLTPMDLAVAAAADASAAPRSDTRGPAGGVPLFVQLSDTHIGFAREANPDVAGTLARAIDLVNALPVAPPLILHTGDITHLSRPAEFDLAQQLLARLRVTELHTVPGEHDVADASVSEYFSRFGQPSEGRGYYSFDHAGVHFVGLVNVLQFKPGGPGTLGAEQLAWVAADLKARSASTPIVVFAHMPLWNIYEPWGWGTGDAAALMDLLRRFGSVTVLNGHIHQIVQKVEGNVTFHTARSTAYPQPPPGVGPGPGPLLVPADHLAGMLGVTSVSRIGAAPALALSDATLADGAAPGTPAARAPAAGTTAAGTAQVLIRDFMYKPVALTVQAGATVTWLNQDDEPHTVVSVDGLFRSGAVDTSERFSYRFDRPGTYRFGCSIHPRMVGSIVVV